MIIVIASIPSTRREWIRVGKGLLFISPWIVGFSTFQFYPFLASLYYSFTRYSILSSPRFIGLDNFKELILKDPRFWVSLYNTLYYTVFTVLLGGLTSLSLAILLNMKVQGMAVYRTIYYLPSIVPVVATSVIWIWLFNPQYGIINTILFYLHLPSIGWFSDPAWSKPALIIMSIWAVGGAVIIYLAGLQDIPQQLYEAATVDGANWWQLFIHITIPMLSPVIFFNMIIGLIGAFQYFTQAYVITGGGPADSTLFYSLYLYFSAFQFFKMGYASAMAWILFLIIMGATLLIFKTSGRWVHYGM
ncbi:MAG: carbohydrate ABC transporter permease [bacterium]